ncbi:MAG: ribose transport system permease protein [Thermoleophilaceae bacterium]|jgi:ribose transport system permease protein|nr:ribose transport system permease protein [Thermoleophilaceae bacterium]
MPSAKAGRSPWFVRLVQGQGLLLAIFLFGFILFLLTPDFLTKTNIINLFFQATILAVFALGMTFVILTAGIDLSVGSVAALTSVLSMGVIVKSGLPPVVGVLIGLLVGVAIGALNGLAVAKLGISALIATLASLAAASGGAFAYSNGSNIAPVPNALTDITRAEVWDIPILIPVVLVFAVFAHLILTRTSFGRGLYAVGGNPEAAKLAGIRVDRVKILAYTICGFTAALAGLMLTARLGSGSPRAGDGVELTAIAAVVIGGTSLFGGQGDIKGSMFGVLLISMVSNAVNLLGVPSAYDQIVQGGVIFTAATLDIYRNRYIERTMSRRARRRGEPPEEGSEADLPGDSEPAGATQALQEER